MVFTRNDISLSWYGDPITVERLAIGLDKEAIRDLGTIMQRRHYNKDQVIFSPDKVPDEVVVVKSGTAAVIDLQNLGNRRTALEEEIFGLTETLAAVPFGRELRTETECEVAVLKKHELVEYLKETSQVCFRSLELVAEHFRSARESALAVASRNM